MGYALGIDLGTTFTTAVVHRAGSEPTVVPLGDRSAAMASVLFLGEDGSVLIGEAAERRALAEPERVVRRFKRRIGDETPLLFGAREGEAFTAHAVAARMIGLVADRVAEREGSGPDAIAITIPAAWGTHKKHLLLTALTREGLLGATLVSEPAAVALAYAHAGRLETGTTLAIYDFGGGTFDVALVRAEADGTSTLLGCPGGLPDLGGIDFDDAVLAYVLGNTDAGAAPEFDGDDPGAVSAMARLRRECVDAKEGLSADTAVTVPVLLGAHCSSVRLTRADFEAMIAAAVQETFTSLDAALASAGMLPSEMHRVLLTGGTSRIPLVTQLLSARYPGVRIERDIDPKLAVAIGGVLSLARPAAGAVVPASPASPAPSAPGTRPERPPIDRDGFDSEIDRDAQIPLVRLRQRRRLPLVLYVAAAVLVAGGLGMSALHPVDTGESLPAASLQEKQVGGAKAAKADKRAEVPADAGAATDVAAAKQPAGTAGGRTEGSADTRAAGSQPARTDDSSVSTAGSSPTSRSGAVGGREQAASERRAASKRSSDSAGSALATAPLGTAAQQAPAAAAPAAPTTTADAAQPAPTAEVADASTDSGSVEAFNDGSADTGNTGTPPSDS